MGRMIAVDPGRNAGIAEFLDGRLVRAWLMRAHEPITYRDGDKAVCEKPLVYRIGAGKGDPSGMIKTGMSGARILALFPESSITHVPPSRWKAQVPKALMCTRVLDRLTDDERALVPGNHNVLDAVGIGLFSLGRMRRGGA